MSNSNFVPLPSFKQIQKQFGYQQNRQFNESKSVHSTKNEQEPSRNTATVTAPSTGPSTGPATATQKATEHSKTSPEKTNSNAQTPTRTLDADSSSPPSKASSQPVSSPFGAAKPVDQVKKLVEMEQKLLAEKAEEEKQKSLNTTETTTKAKVRKGRKLLVRQRNLKAEISKQIGENAQKDNGPKQPSKPISNIANIGMFFVFKIYFDMQCNRSSRLIY